MSLWENTVPGGASSSVILRRGNSLRLEDIEGGGNAGALFYNWDCMVERYSTPDTLKAQHIAHLTAGFVLYSDRGRILASLTADSCGWHDPLGGHNDAKTVGAKYGRSTSREARNVWRRNPHDNFLIEAAQYGLGPRDIGPSVNFFSKVTVSGGGAMEFVPGNSKPGDFVELRAEMNLLVILASGRHPLDPDPNYAPKPIRFSITSSVRSATIPESADRNSSSPRPSPPRPTEAIPATAAAPQPPGPHTARAWDSAANLPPSTP